MNKKIIYLIILILVVAAMGVYIIYSNKSATSIITNSIPTTSVPTIITPTTTVPAATTSIIIDIRNFAFNPATLTISKRATVIWTNYDSAPHKIKSDFGFNSDNLNQSDTYQYQFSKTGTFNYYCAIHPYMKGTIIVR